jgi:hypothetical protein
MKYQLKEFNRNVSAEDLLGDLKLVAEKLGLNKISSRQYNDNGGKYTSGTIIVRFGGWNSALKRAGLNLVQRRDVSEVELFKNLEEVWISIGQQPTFRDMKPPASKFSTHQYVSKFGAWRKALGKFVDYINSTNPAEQSVDEIEEKIVEKPEKIYKHKTKRLPSERLKVQVLMRDGNICRLCGITLTGDNIHFDHITPWSKGGETVLENLQILCAKHNLAKGDLEYR